MKKKDAAPNSLQHLFNSSRGLTDVLRFVCLFVFFWFQSLRYIYSERKKASAKANIFLFDPYYMYYSVYQHHIEFPPETT